MKLSVYAKKVGIHYNTAYTHFRAGLIRGAYRLPTGTIIVPEEAIPSMPFEEGKPQPPCSKKYRRNAK